jgi:hypothetical protein
MDCQRWRASLTSRSLFQHADTTAPNDFAVVVATTPRRGCHRPPQLDFAAARCPPPSAGRPPASAVAPTKLVSPSSMENTTGQSSGAKHRRSPVWLGFPRLGRGHHPTRRRQCGPVDRQTRSFFAMDSRVAYALARMIFLGDQTSGRRCFAPTLCSVVFSIDDGETSFVGTTAEACGRPAEGGGRWVATKSGRGRRQRPRRGVAAAAGKLFGTVALAC